MVNCFIQFGATNRKLIIPFILTLLSLLHYIYIEFILKNKGNVIITEFSSSIGHMAIIIIPYIKCLSIQKKGYKNQINKNYILNYIIYFSIYLCHLLLLVACTHLKRINEEEEKDKSNILFLTGEVHDLYSVQSIEIIFTTIVSFFLLSYKYSRHHYICLVLFILLSIGIDINSICFGESEKKFYKLYLIASIAQLLFESIAFSFQKYMFDKLYYSPYYVCFAFGVFFLCYNLCTLLVFIITGNNDYLNYFTNVSVGYEIFKFISNIFMVFFLYTFMALTNYYFTPNHLVCIDQLGKMIRVIVNESKNLKYIYIFPFSLQLIILMIFLEILELNFCGLNKNSKKNIQIRAISEMNDLDKDDDIDRSETDIEIVPGYMISEKNLERNTTSSFCDEKKNDVLIETE